MHIPGYARAHKKGLPIMNSILSSTSSVAHEPWNMTQISIGLVDDSQLLHSKSAVPSVARGRGMSSKVRTPSEDRRYKMVECLRLKEEKRGFTGRKLQKYKSARLTISGHHRAVLERPGSVSVKQWGPGKLIDSSNIDILIRPNSRSFTTLTNSGFTRSEKLVDWVPLHYDHGTAPALSGAFSKTVDEENQATARKYHVEYPEDCFRRTFKDKTDSSYSWLPDRRFQEPNSRENSGFSARSYRNPAKADILAEFPAPSSVIRPRTTNYGRQLLPSPYFQSNSFLKQEPYMTKHQRSTLGLFIGDCDYQATPAPTTSLRPGSIAKPSYNRPSLTAGSVELLTRKEFMSRSTPPVRSVKDSKESSTVHPTIKYQTVEQPQADKQSHGDEGKEKEVRGKGDLVGVEKTTERTRVNVKVTTVDTDEVADDSRQRPVITSHVLIVGDVSGNSSGRSRPRLTTSNSGAEIMLGLETDDGKTAEVEIDSLETDELQPEEIPKGRVRKTSIVEKLSKSKESELIALSILENAGQRQREFEKLINEHQELVQEISRTPSAENIVQSETGRDP